jgi:Protein of unknown function (DUF4013)
MDNIQETLLFPVRDAESRKQFLIACVVMLSAFIIPILPTLVLMGYSARIMRQVIEEKRNPTMPSWQGSDISEMLLDGLRLWGAQLVLTLPLLLLMGCGMIFMMSGSIGFAALSENNVDSFAPVGMLLFILGFLFFGIFGILSLPYSVIISAALPHVAVKRSFQAAFEFKEWFAIFRKALGQFILGYAVIMIASFIVAIVMQIAMVTIILICIIPFLMIPYIAYQMLIMNTVFAQAYAVGQEALQPKALEAA